MKTNGDSTGPFPIAGRQKMPIPTIRHRDLDATPTKPHQTLMSMARKAAPAHAELVSSVPTTRISSVPPPPPTPLRVELAAAQERISELERTLRATKDDAVRLQAMLASKEVAWERASSEPQRTTSSYTPLLGLGLLAVGSLVGLAFDAVHLTVLSGMGALAALLLIQGVRRPG